MEKIFDVIIIGGGPAGLTAAIYAARSGLDAVVFEGRTPGGQLNTIVKLENYPGFPDGISGIDLSDRFVEQVKKFGAEIIYQPVDSVKKEGDLFNVSSYGEAHLAKTVIIATGLSQHLGVTGEDEYLGKGVSYCATCDAPLYRGLTTAIIGGSNHAVEEGLKLASFAKTVYIITAGAKLNITEELTKALRAKQNVRPIAATKVIEIYGEKNLVTGIKVENLHTKEVSDLKLEGVFIYLGKRTPETNFLEIEVERNEKGYLKVDSLFMTSVDGLFSIGDVRAKSAHQVATAVGDAAACAMHIKTFIVTRDK